MDTAPCNDSEKMLYTPVRSKDPMNELCCICGIHSMCPNDFGLEGRHYCPECFFKTIEGKSVVYQSFPSFASFLTQQAMYVTDWGKWFRAHPAWEGTHWEYTRLKKKHHEERDMGALGLVDDDSGEWKGYFVFRNCPVPPIPKYEME